MCCIYTPGGYRLESMTTTNFQVTGMHCGDCATKVRQQVEQVPGVQALTVDASTGTVAVEASEPLDEAAVLEAVQRAGYQAVRT